MVRKALYLSAALAAVALYAGCNQSADDPPQAAAPPNHTSQKADDHAHDKPGTHGGLIVNIGRDNYHAEVVFDRDGTVRLYLLGKDESKVQEVEVQTLKAHVKAEGDSGSTEIVFQPKPQDGDAAGRTSQFVAALPAELRGKAVEFTVPNLRIGGERFRFAFASAREAAHDEEAEMPAKVQDDEERRLYLTPGGLYTEADIKANGGVTASEKFKGVMAAHDLKPKAGDRLCPVTLTKANPKFRWVVGGKTYEFCCPPCIDEFVQLAKTQPEQVGKPEEYVKKK